MIYEKKKSVNSLNVSQEANGHTKAYAGYGAQASTWMTHGKAASNTAWPGF